MPQLLKQILHDTQQTLHSAGIENSYMESRWLLEHIMGNDATRLTSDKNVDLKKEQTIVLETLLGRRKKGEPLAYVLGHVPFHNIDVLVTPDVLIPRPETEELVEMCLNQIYKQKQGRLLDLACGSGCIGIAVGKEMNEWDIDLSDISNTALAISKKNVEHNLGKDYLEKFNFIESDLYEKLPQKTTYEIIVCNPPYIYPDEKKNIDDGVLDYEPHLALFHDDPVELYSLILKESSLRLQKKGMFVAELSDRIAKDVYNHAIKYFKSCEIIKDVSQKDRFISCQNPL